MSTLEQALLAGKSLGKACKIAGISKGKAWYDLHKANKAWMISRKADRKRSPKDSRILNPELAKSATYYLDSCHLHLEPVYRHYRKGIGVSMLAIVEKPNRVVGIKLILGEPNQVDWSRFLREVKLPKGCVLLSDVGNEFCGIVPDTVQALGLKLCRMRGWIEGKQTKPWIEGLFGLFQNRYLRPVLKEHIEALSLMQVFEECHTLVNDMLVDLHQQITVSKLEPLLVTQA